MLVAHARSTSPRPLQPEQGVCTSGEALFRTQPLVPAAPGVPEERVLLYRASHPLPAEFLEEGSFTPVPQFFILHPTPEKGRRGSNWESRGAHCTSGRKGLLADLTLQHVPLSHLSFNAFPVARPCSKGSAVTWPGGFGSC